MLEAELPTINPPIHPSITGNLQLQSQIVLQPVELIIVQPRCEDAKTRQPAGACRTVNDLIWKEIQEKNAQFKADNDAYWEAEQVYRKWYAEERKRR